MGMHGLDPEAVERLARRFHDMSNRIGDAINRVEHGLRVVEWTGPDRERFESDFTTVSKHYFRQLQSLLDQESRQLRGQAAAQRQVSGR